jgi:chemotaxis protein MotB
MRQVLFFIFSAMLLVSCVSKKKFAEMSSLRDQAEAALAKMGKDLKDCDEERSKLKADLAGCNDNLNKCQSDLTAEKNKSKSLQEQLDYMRETNTTLLARLADLSVVSKSSAESIKKSLDAIEGQSKQIKDLTASMQRRDSLNLALVMNLKRSLSDVNDTDVNIEVKKGVVYVSLSDKMLFRSGSAVITRQAETILEKIAKILNDHKELDVLVEGHTDNVPIATDCVADNWDLSAKRATTVVRTLNKKYSVDASRMTAGGRSEFVPIADNATPDGRSKNRRTEIIILPKLDQFFQLMENQK